MNKLSEKQIDGFVKELAEYALVGNYKPALTIAKRMRDKYPNELVVQYQYAKLLGDAADELPDFKKKKLKLESARILKKLTKKLSGQPLARRFGICLNYYYQTELFKEIYQYGKRFMTQDRSKGLYAQGLGACLYAEQLLKSNKKTAAKKWAEKSEKNWRKYQLKSERYYYAHYIFSKSLVMLGKNTEALRSLRKAARLGKRPITDWEFADVLQKTV